MAWVFWIVTILFVLSAVTGIFLDVKYYPLKRKIIREIHIWISYLVLIFMIVHLYQNWNWVKGCWHKVRKVPSKVKELVWVFWGMTVTLIIVNLTGISLHLHYIVLPRGWTKYLHDYIGYLFIVLCLVHLYQNRRYISNLFKKR